MKKLLMAIFSIFLLCMCAVSWSLDPDDPALVALWLCDDGTGDTLADSSGNGNDASGDFDWDEGKFDNGILISGGAITVPTSDSINSIKEGLTVAAWFRIDADSDTGIRRQNAFLLEDQSATEKVPNGFAFRVWTRDGLCPGAYGTTELEHGEWYHVAGTYDGEFLNLYINGVAEQEFFTEAGGEFNGEWNGDVAAPGDLLQLKYSAESYTGAMDEIVLFNRALTEAEINELVKGWSSAILLSVTAQEKLSTTWGRIRR